MPVTINKILCAVALRDCTEKVIKYAASLAKRYNAILYLLTVVEEPAWVQGGYDADLESLFSTLEERDRLALRDLAMRTEELSKSQVEPYVLRGKPYNKILEFADEKGVDLIVIGSHTVPPIQKVLLGSTAEKVIHKAKVPVLVVPIYKG